MDFDRAFELLIGHEGGYTDGKGDPGGRTKYGISQRAYPGEDIAALTLDRAKAIYLRDYWRPAGCDLLPDALRFDVFDLAVNSGVKTAVKTLQRAVGAVDDGILGPKTIRAAQMTPVDAARRRIAGQRLQLMTRQPTWDRFGRGWAGRVAANLLMEG